MAGVVVFDGGERLRPPSYDTDEIAVATPPEVPRSPSNQLVRYLPIVTAVAAVAAMAAAYYLRSAVARNPAFMMFPLMMLVSAFATVVSGADRRRSEINVRRADYLTHLSELRDSVCKTAAAQHYSMLWCHPEPDLLWTLAGGRRMWERTPTDSDFCQIRIGVGDRPLATRLVVTRTESASRSDPMCAAASRRFVQAHATVPNMPITVGLRDAAAVTISGDPQPARALVRAMICQLAVMHSPATVLITAIVSDDARPEWDWVKWLPHNRHPLDTDDVGPVRMVYRSASAARESLERLSVPHIVVVVDDGGDDPRWAATGVTMLVVDGCQDEPVVVRVSSEHTAALHDHLSPAAALQCAQRLAGYRAGQLEATRSGTAWQDLVGIVDVAQYSASAHRAAKPGRVPVGTMLAGGPVELDINEAAANGMGPHGLCIGATGSGKSEFLRTVALGMIVGHSSEDLNLVLIDFKGGATFAGLEPAPHVAALITNLSDKAALVARMRDALLGELNRRQEVLRAAGNLDGIAAYRRKRRIVGRLVPLPALFVIVDEFSELLSRHPDFAEVFVAIGRLGRSLGVHLLLASQRLDEGRLRGLESHLSYRVCLKTLSASESRALLGTSDAYELPASPGAAYLRVGTDTPVRFQTAFVSGRDDTAAGERALAQPHAPVRRFSSEPTGPIVFGGGPDTDAVAGPTVLETVIQGLDGDGPRAHEVWLPPLGVSPTLEAVLADAGPGPALTAAIGIVDRPFEQRREPLTVDVSRSAGNVAVVGAPQSGKSTALCTLITALAANHDPRAVQFYCLDFGGGMLASLRDCPHVGSVAGRADPERVRRTIARLAAIMRARDPLP